MTIESAVEELIAEPLHSIGYEIVRIRYGGNHTKNLQIMLDRLDGGNIKIEDCETASRLISSILDVEDPVTEHYNLEVSSPGIDRPLVKLQDFIRFKGFEAKISLITKFEGREHFKGKLIDVVDEKIIVLDKAIENEVALDFKMIRSAKLLLTDDLIKATQNEA